MRNEIHQADRTGRVFWKETQQKKRPEGRKRERESGGEEVQCIPRYIRRLPWLRYRMMPGDAVEGLGLRLPPTKPSEGVIRGICHMFNS